MDDDMEYMNADDHLLIIVPKPHQLSLDGIKLEETETMLSEICCIELVDDNPVVVHTGKNVGVPPAIPVLGT
jgi:hypothetical protein